jgi:hypothetical protein
MKRLVTAALAAALLAGCGGGGNSSTASAGAAQGQQGRGPFAQLTASQRTCLQKAGLSAPQRPPGGGSQPPANSGGRSSGSSADRQGRFAKLQAAFKKCGIQLPSRPGAPGGTSN